MPEANPCRKSSIRRPRRIRCNGKGALASSIPRTRRKRRKGCFGKSNKDDKCGSPAWQLQAKKTDDMNDDILIYFFWCLLSRFKSQNPLKCAVGVSQDEDSTRSSRRSRQGHWCDQCCNFHLVRDGCSRLHVRPPCVCIMYAYCSVYTVAIGKYCAPKNLLYFCPVFPAGVDATVSPRTIYSAGPSAAVKVNDDPWQIVTSPQGFFGEQPN